MSVETEVFRMLYELDPTGSIPRAQKDVALYEHRLELLARAGTSTGMTLAQLEGRIREVSAAKHQAIARLEAFEAAQRRANGTLGLAAGRMKGLAGSAQTLGYSFQDLAQGGVGAILNNLDRLGSTFAAIMGKSAAVGAAIGGVATVIGTSLYLVGPAVTRFFRSLLDGSNKVPEATKVIEQMTDRLGKMKKEFDGLKDKPSLTNTELAKFLELRTGIAGQEERIAAARERQAAADALSGLKGKATTERAAALADLVGNAEGGAAKFTGAVAIGLRDQARADLQAADRERDRIVAANRRGRASPAERRWLRDFDGDVHPMLRGRIDAGTASEADRRAYRDAVARSGRGRMAARASADVEAFRQEAATLGGQATRDGDLAAFRRIERMIEARPGAFGPAIAQGWATASPEQRALEERGAEQGRAVMAHQARLAEAAARKREQDAAEDRREAEGFERVRDRAAGRAAARARMDDDPQGLNAANAADRAALGRGLADVLPRFEAALAQRRLENDGLPPAEARAANESLRRRMVDQAEIVLRRGGTEPERAAALAEGAPQMAREGLDRAVVTAQQESQTFSRQALTNQEATQRVLAQILATQRAFGQAAARQALELEQLRREAIQAGATFLPRGNGF